MDAFWDFIEPLVYNNNLLTKYDEFLKNQFGFNENYQVREITAIVSGIPYIVKMFWLMFQHQLFTINVTSIVYISML